MITTNKVTLSQYELFFILLVRCLKNNWWIFIIIWGVAIYSSLKDYREIIDEFFIASAFIYPFIIVLKFWRFVASKENKIYLIDRYYDIDSEKITIIIDFDTYSIIKLEHFIKVDVISKTYLLYIAKNLFIYIPFDSFETDSEKEWFETHLISKIREQTFVV